MPPKQSASAGGASRGRPAGSKNKADKVAAADKGKGKQRAVASQSPDPQEEERMDVDRGELEKIDDGEDDDDQEQTIPPDLLTRILAEFFEKDGTRITRDANNAVAKYMDIFVKEAIARAAAERGSGFLEVEDLEKIAPQLLLDL